MANPWLAGLRLAQLGIEAQSVIALRMLKFAEDGPFAKKEARRMVSEKIAAFAEAQMAIAMAVGFGRAETAPAKAVAVYRRRVKANQRRLSGGR